MSSRVPLNSRRAVKAAVSRAFHRALGRADVTQAEAADVLDVDPSVVSRKASPECPDGSVGVHDLVSLLVDERTRAAGVELLRWVAEQGELDVAPRIIGADVHSVALCIADLEERGSRLATHALRSSVDGYVDVDEAAEGRARAIHLIEVCQALRDWFTTILRERGRRVSLVPVKEEAR